MKILVLNAGSSSQKLRLYELAGNAALALTAPPPIWAADADWGGKADKVTITLTVRGKRTTDETPLSQREMILTRLLQSLWQGEQAVIERPGEIAVIGHRVVHGGTDYAQSVRITPQVQDYLRRLVPFAPLHQPSNLAGIDVCEKLFDTTPQIAVFDTAYHRHLPQVAQIYPGPYAWFEQGIRRYGFHGISHQYCAQRSVQLTGQDLAHARIITCHLGNGCSLAATRNGQSIDTTMGFTPLEGLMMGTRSGSIDPAILLYLQREQDSTPGELDKLLNQQSGLKGISGLSSDMREILQASAQGNERASLALDLYIYRLRACLGSMIAALEGLDLLTFTAGVGEHAPLIRARVCQSLSFLGLALDEVKNATATGDQEISAPNSTARVLVVHTEEDWQIARECWEIVSITGGDMLK